MMEDIDSITLEFLAGTPIGKACEQMYFMLCEKKCNIKAVFNGIEITMENR